MRDLEIAQKDHFLDVKFTYCYQALIKIKILNKPSEIVGDPDIFMIGNVMRMKRNKGLYDLERL